MPLEKKCRSSKQALTRCAELCSCEATEELQSLLRHTSENSFPLEDVLPAPSDVKHGGRDPKGEVRLGVLEAAGCSSSLLPSAWPQLQTSPCKPCPSRHGGKKCDCLEVSEAFRTRSSRAGGIAPEYQDVHPQPYLHTAGGARSTPRFSHPGWCSGWRALRGAGTRDCRCML